MLRIVLNDGVREFTIERNDPININALILKVKRREQYDGVVAEVIVNLQFIKEAIPYIKNAFLTRGGIDALVQVTVMEYNPNQYLWEVYQRGKINFNDYTFDNTTLTVTVEQVSEQSLVTNALATDTTLTSTEVVTLHSKKLLEVYQTKFFDSLNTSIAAGTHYLIFGTDALSETNFIDELEDRITNYPAQINTATPMAELKYLFIAKYAWSARVILNFYQSFLNGVIIRNWDTQWKLTYGTLSGGYTTVDLGANITAVSSSPVGDIIADESFTCNKGDEIYIYCEVVITGATGGAIFNADPINPGDAYKMRVEALTETLPSECNGVLLFEAVQQCLTNISGGKVLLRSDLMGRTDIGYDEDGDASLILWTNGNYIRGAITKDLFANLDQILGFLNAAFCIGFGFEVEDNVTYMVVERKSYFFDKTTQVATLAGQYDFETKLLRDKYYNIINYGYSGKLELRQVNATDDFNTLRSLSMPIKNSKNILNITTNVRANGSEIEYQRRLINASEDSNLDDQNFVIVVVRDGDDYVAKKMEGYDAVSGVYDAATGYNYDISPSRMLLNWYEYLASNVIYSLSKVATFASGTGNYQASTTKTGEETLVENADVDLSLEQPIFDCFTYQLSNVPFTRDQMDLTKADPFGYYSFCDKDNVVRKGFLSSDGIDHDSNNNRANITLLKLA